MSERIVTAIETANAAGVDPKRFRRRLREAGLQGHNLSDRWSVREASEHHRDMVRVLDAVSR